MAAFETALGDVFEVPDDWWREAGASSFHASGNAFTLGPPERKGLPDGQEVAISDIRPPRRCSGTAGLVRHRAVAILSAFREGAPLPPVVVYAVPDGPFSYRLAEGFHRFHLSIAVGYTLIPAVVLDHWEPWMTGDPMP